MFISLHYRYCLDGIFTAPMQWNVPVSREQYVLFADAVAKHRDEYDRIAPCADADGQCGEVLKLNYRIAQEVLPEWCADQVELLENAYCNVRTVVCVDGCEACEGDPEVKDVVVELGYSVSFGRDEEDEGDVLIPYSTSMSWEDYILFLKNKPGLEPGKLMLDFNDVAGVLPVWADRVYNDIVNRETVKFRREPYYEIWGFTKDEINAPDWRVTAIADIYLTVEVIGMFENV